MPSVLITGTSSGLGLGVATRLHDLGWDVLGTVLDRADEDRVPWATVVCDVTDDDSVAALGLVVDQRFGGRLDALVNNAGIAMAGPWEELVARGAAALARREPRRRDGRHRRLPARAA